MRCLTLVLAAVAIGMTACREEPTAPRGETGPGFDQTASPTLEGPIHVLWGDPQGAGQALLRYVLIDDRGRPTELVLDPVLASRLGGPRGLDRKRVKVRGEADARGRVLVRSIELARLADAVGAEPAAMIGSRPYITIGCKFSDIADVPRALATYQNWTAGNSYPGLNHYWRELSYNKMDVAGSTVVGWYTLPFPRAHYVPGGADLWALLTDCARAADPDVNFPSYYGINLQFNAYLDCCSWGGSATLTLDGQTKAYGVTWLASWSDVALIAHEEGHSLGLPHSSGPYGQTYDSQWDVMSNRCTYYDGAQASCIPQHTIGFHKGLLGWIPATRVFTAQPNTSQTITLERLAQPSVGNYLLAYIPLQNTPGNVEYSVEARRLVGYDSHLPANAVVLHRVAGSATVVDVDNNGDPNDAGAEWTVGETFTDAANGISMRVNAMTATGFQITITLSSGNIWVAKAPMPSARNNLAATALGGRLYAIGGLNNGTAQRSVFAYTPSSNSWSAKALLPAVRTHGSGVAALSGKIYVAGGLDAAKKPSRTLYVYTVATNTWATKAAMPVASGCGGAAIISGKLYVFTGCTLSSTGALVNAGLLERYDLSTNTWTKLRTAPSMHYQPAVAAVGGKLYVAGGDGSSGSRTGRLDVYDPATNTWATRAPMPTVRVGAAGAAIGSLLYVVGGQNAIGYLRTFEAYNPTTNSWTTRAAMPTARAGLGASFISLDSGFYAVGGANTSGLQTNERYTP